MTQEDSTSKSKRPTQRGNPPKALVESMRCPGCDEVQPRDAFQRDRHKLSGLRVPCKACMRQGRPAGGKIQRPRDPLPDGFSQCHQCGDILPIELFHKNRRRRQGVTQNCKACAEVIRRANTNIPMNRARSWLKVSYGISLDDRDAMIAEQGGMCAICTAPFRSARDTHTDHNHRTGKVRGILCRRCNVALGYAHDDPAVLRRMAEYIEKHL